MNRVAALVAGLAALTVISTAAEAAQGCGKGYHYNGQRCVPQGGPDHRQPYHPAPRLSRGSSADLGDHYRPSHRRHGSSADLSDHYRPSHRRHGISVDLGPIGRLHFHHGGKRSHHLDED
jgi:hypothetical protein